MFTLTRAAAQQIQRAAQDMVLRVAAQRLADGSLDYGMGFDESADNDTRLLIEDVAVVLAPSHAQLLEDTVLDFVELEPGHFNFIFVNQQSAFTTASGCGSGSGGGGGCGSGGCSTGGCSTH